MASHRLHIKNALNTIFIVTGGVMIGGAIHQSIVKGAISPTAPITVFMVVIGGILAAIGYRFRVSPDTMRDRFTPSEPDDGEASHDPSLSPIGDSPGAGEDEDGNT